MLAELRGAGARPSARMTMRRSHAVTRASRCRRVTLRAGPLLAQAPAASGRSSATSAPRPASRFQHHSAPEKKYIVESMSGGVALFDYDNDGKARPLLRRLADRRHRERPEGGAQRALPQPGRQQLRGRDRQGRRRPPGLGHGRLHGRRRRRRLGGPLRHRPRRQPALPQQPRRHVHRHRRAAPA